MNIDKIKKDYLRQRGVSDPEPEIFDIIEPISVSQLLKIVIIENKGVPDKILADRYNVKQNTIRSIKSRGKK